jgi:hypothetical protein
MVPQLFRSQHLVLRVLCTGDFSLLVGKKKLFL